MLRTAVFRGLVPQQAVVEALVTPSAVDVDADPDDTAPRLSTVCVMRFSQRATLPPVAR